MIADHIPGKEEELRQKNHVKRYSPVKGEKEICFCWPIKRWQGDVKRVLCVCVCASYTEDGINFMNETGELKKFVVNKQSTES